jgi:hypothetical protein
MAELPNLLGQIIKKATLDSRKLPQFLKLEFEDAGIVLIHAEAHEHGVQIKAISHGSSEEYTGIELPWIHGGPITEVTFEDNKLEITQNYSTSFTASLQMRDGQPELRLSYD